MQENAEIHYIAIDPGEKYNGWATFKDNGNLITMGTVFGVDHITDFLEQLDTENLKDVIVEDYRVGAHGSFSANHHRGSRVDTIKTIGRIESWAYRHGLRLHLQPNSIKPVGYMWAGIPVPKRKELSHETDAYVHGVYFLQRKGIRVPQQARRADA